MISINKKKFLILFFVSVSFSITSLILLKINNTLSTNIIDSETQNTNHLFSDKKISLSLKNDNISNITFDATPSDNKIYVATKNFIFNVDTSKSINITPDNYLKNDAKTTSLFVNLLPYISKTNNSYVDQMIFDKNNNMFFDYKNTNTNFTNNLFVKNVKSTNNNPFKIVLPPNVDAVSYFSVSYDGKYIVIRSKNTNQIYISLIPKNFLSKFDWVNITLPNKTDNLYLSYFAFDNNNDLYITNKDTIYIINSNLLVYNINLSNKIKLPFITSIANIDLKSGIQIHINQNNKILLSTSFKNNSTTYNNYFYTTKTSDALTKPSSYVIANNDYVDTKNKNNQPYFNYNSAKLGIKDSIALLNNGIDTHNVVGLYYSPTGVPIKKIKDSSNKNNIGTFAMYGGETITQGNAPIVSAVNRFDSSLNKVAFASLNSVAIGNYNLNTILTSGPKDYNQFNKTFTIPGIISIVLGCVVALFTIVTIIIITISIIKTLSVPLSTGDPNGLINDLVTENPANRFLTNSLINTDIEYFQMGNEEKDAIYNRLISIIRNDKVAENANQLRSDIKWLKYFSNADQLEVNNLRQIHATKEATDRLLMGNNDASVDMQNIYNTTNDEILRTGLTHEEISNFNIDDYIRACIPDDFAINTHQINMNRSAITELASQPLVNGATDTTNVLDDELLAAATAFMENAARTAADI